MTATVVLRRPRGAGRSAQSFFAALGLVLLVGCGGGGDEGPSRPPVADAVVGVPGDIALVPGPPEERPSVPNRYAGDENAIAEGGRLYTWYNCADCHGTLGGGGMGPPLRDGNWIYGGEPIDIYRSIMEGRPEGMPGWIGKIPDDQVWKIVAYLRVLPEGGGPPPSLRPPAHRVPGGGGAGTLSPTEP